MKIKRTTALHYNNPVPVYDVINANPYNNFFIKTNSSYVVSHNSKIMSVYTNIRRRMDSRFMVQGKNYGLMFLVSSKATESSFLEAYIADQVKKNYPIYVVDRPLWDIKPAAYSGKRFKVAVGNKYIQSRIIDDTENLDEVITSLKAQGLRIIDVPIEHRQAFDQNLDKALQDIAGISTSTVTKAFSGMKIDKCISEELENPFYTDIVTIGTHDELKLQDFFDRDKIPDSVKNSPIFIHLDASVSGDRTGLSAVGIAGSKKQLNYGADVGEEHTSEELIFQQVFSIGIQAPSSDEISFEKTRQFIYWLRDEVGLNVVLVSTDGFQSVDTRQILSSKGFEVGYTSLDRTPDGYDGLRSAINDGRIILLQGCKTLKNELTELERDNMTRKYDHPISGCFTGDTKIKLVDGRSLTILELLREQEYKQNWVYTFNETTKKIEPKPIKKVFQTKITSDLVKVTLDNGESIVCTPDHRFMLRDGSYEEIQNLLPGDSLMPLYTKLSKEGINGYRLYYEPLKDTWHYEHRNFCLNGEGSIVHHRNFNKLNNCPSNLKRMSQSEHATLHNNLTKDYSLVSKAMKVWHKENKGSDVYKERFNKVANTLRENSRVKNFERDQEREEYIKKLENRFNVKYNELSTTDRLRYSSILVRELDPSINQRTSSTLSKRHQEGKFKRVAEVMSTKMWITDGQVNKLVDKDSIIPEGFRRGRVVSEETKEKMRITAQKRSEEEKQLIRERISKDTSSRIWVTNGEVDKYIKKTDSVPDGFYKGRSKVGKNHKIVSIERIHYPCRVYDLEIEDNHNFALEAGVIVHNSKDIADSLAGAFLDASNYKDEYLYFNPIDESFEDLNIDRDDKKDLLNDMTRDLIGVNTSNFSVNDVNATMMNFGYDDPSIVII